MTSRDSTPAGPGASRQAAPPPIPGSRPGDKDTAETREPYDLPFPDAGPPGRPEYVIVVDQLRGWQPARPLSLAEALETGLRREPEADREAEP